MAESIKEIQQEREKRLEDVRMAGKADREEIPFLRKGEIGACGLGTIRLTTVYWSPHLLQWFQLSTSKITTS